MEAGGEGQGEASVAGGIDKASWWRSEQHHVLRQYTHGIETRTTRGGFTLRSGVLQVAWLVSEANAYTALTIPLLSVRLWFVTAFALDPSYQPSQVSIYSYWGCCWSHCIEGFFDKET